MAPPFGATPPGRPARKVPGTPASPPAGPTPPTRGQEGYLGLFSALLGGPSGPLVALPLPVGFPKRPGGAEGCWRDPRGTSSRHVHLKLCACPFGTRDVLRHVTPPPAAPLRAVCAHAEGPNGPFKPPPGLVASPRDPGGSKLKFVLRSPPRNFLSFKETQSRNFKLHAIPHLRR